MGISRFVSINRHKFDLIQNKDPDKIYFVSDGAIYKGDVPYTNRILQVDRLPDIGEIGIIYLCNDTISVWDGDKYISSATAVFDGNINDDDDNQSGVVDVSALKKYINKKINSHSNWEIIE